jgi:hypothetical protein
MLMVPPLVQLCLPVASRIVIRLVAETVIVLTAFFTAAIVVGIVRSASDEAMG